MKQILVILTMAIVAVCPAHGRVGETKEQIDQRYGAGQVSDIQRLQGAETFKYLKGNFQIEVVIYQGKSIWEIFQRHDVEITDADIKEILKASTEKTDSSAFDISTGPEKTWHFNQTKKLWERSGEPKLVGYRWPGHEDYFCVKDIAACDGLEKQIKGTPGF